MAQNWESDIIHSGDGRRFIFAVPIATRRQRQSFPAKPQSMDRSGSQSCNYPGGCHGVTVSGVLSLWGRTRVARRSKLSGQAGEVPSADIHLHGITASCIVVFLV